VELPSSETRTAGQVLIPIILCLVLAVSRAVFRTSPDEHLIPLAQCGSWVAVEHRPSMTDPPDVWAASAISAVIVRMTRKAPTVLTATLAFPEAVGFRRR
jgi:hypothetical protein